MHGFNSVLFQLYASWFKHPKNMDRNINIIKRERYTRIAKKKLRLNVVTIFVNIIIITFDEHFTKMSLHQAMLRRISCIFFRQRKHFFKFEDFYEVMKKFKKLNFSMLLTFPRMAKIIVLKSVAIHINTEQNESRRHHTLTEKEWYTYYTDSDEGLTDCIAWQDLIRPFFFLWI